VVAAAAPIYAAPLQPPQPVYMAGEDMGDYYPSHTYVEEPYSPTEVEEEETVHDSLSEVAAEEPNYNEDCSIAELLSKPFEEWSQEDYERYYLYEEQQQQQVAQH
jgi:hypothetical protein